MGTLMKNGIPYGGGGDNSKTVTYADYLKLPQEEKTCGITYFIPDYPEEEPNQNLGNMRYNEENDMVQIKVGEYWIDWKKAGLLWDGYVYKQYTGAIVDLTKAVSTNSSSNEVIDITSTDYIYMTISNTRQGLIVTNEKIDTTGYKTLKIDMSMEMHNPSYAGQYSIGLSSNKDLDNTMNAVVKSGTFATMTRKTVSLDLSNYQGEFFFKAFLNNNSNGYTNTIKFYNIYLE